MGNRKIEITVGVFLLAVICAVLFLCFKVADLSTLGTGPTYRIYAVFDNIGGLKARSPIKIGGVVAGRVQKITLNDDSGAYKPYVTIDMNPAYDRIPSSSALSIKTSGVLGEQYIAIDLGINADIIDEIDALDSDTSNKNNKEAPQFEYFREGFVVHNTKPAVELEDLIGQFLYKSDSTSASTDSQEK